MWATQAAASIFAPSIETLRRLEFVQSCMRAPHVHHEGHRMHDHQMPSADSQYSIAALASWVDVVVVPANPPLPSSPQHPGGYRARSWPTLDAHVGDEASDGPAGGPDGIASGTQKERPATAPRECSVVTGRVGVIICVRPSQCRQQLSLLCRFLLRLFIHPF